MPYKCDNGHVFLDSNAISIINSVGSRISGNKVRCECGALATNISGTYSHDSTGRITSVKDVRPEDQSIIDAILKAFRAPDVTQEKIEALRAVAEATKAGTLNAIDAAHAAKEIAPSLGELWKWLNVNGGAIGAVSGVASLLIAMIALFLTIEGSHASDLALAQAHADRMQTHQDAQILLSVQEQQLQVQLRQFQDQQRDYEFQQKMYELLAAQRQTDEMQAKPSPHLPSNHGKNRHERRKAIVQERSKKR